MASYKFLFLLSVALLLLLPTPTAAFGAGNIASIAKIEGHNWRHGDIEDMLKTVACLKGHKWTSMMIKRVYFGNWLRDYSQAVDVGTLKGVQADTIRILVWVLAFMSFGYATGEFEVTAERLGVYRPEEHIDNPKDYADNEDARKYDPRLRPPVQPQELDVDPNTGMKNYIANEYGGWATSTGYIKHSFARSIHFGRVYTSGGQNSGREEDLCEALRCLGQGLHCMEDFGAHTNYTELALRELGYTNVFPHTGTATAMNIRGKHVFPLVTGTFGGVDFLHSVLGEATDHFTQSEIDEMNTALSDAAGLTPSGGKKGAGDSNPLSGLTDLLNKVPGTGGMIQEAQRLQASSDAHAAAMSGARGFDDLYSSSRAGPTNPQQPPSFQAPPGSQGGPPGPGIPGMSPNFDPSTIVPKIYPILLFRDNVVRSISAIISKIPGLESLIDAISERVTLFVLSLLAPFIQPLISAASEQLKLGSSAVVDSSGKHQYEPWTDPHCTNPTHSLLSKDHFSNILNEPAGQVAATILQYVAPRIVYAWDHPDVPVDQVLHDVTRVFHHPAFRDNNIEAHRNMYAVVEKWSRMRRGPDLNKMLSSESVRAGKNHIGGAGNAGYTHSTPGAGAHGGGSSSHSKVSGSPFDLLGKAGKFATQNIPGVSSGMPGGGKRDLDAPMGATAAPGFTDPYPSAYAQPDQGQQPAYGATQYDYDQTALGGASDDYTHTYQTSYNAGFNEPAPSPGLDPGVGGGAYSQVGHQDYGYGGTGGGTYDQSQYGGQYGGYDQGGYGQQQYSGGYDQGQYDQGQYGQGGYDQSQQPPSGGFGGSSWYTPGS